MKKRVDRKGKFKYYNDVATFKDKDKTVYKLYRDGKLIYIGVKNNETRK